MLHARAVSKAASLEVLTFGQIATRGAGPDENQRPPTFPRGAAGTVIIGSWLVEAKQRVIQNMAPVLTRLLTPLFTMLVMGPAE